MGTRWGTLEGMATRRWEGITVPEAGPWRILHESSELALVARYLRLARLRMRFRRFEGELLVGRDPRTSSLEASVEAASIDTGIGVLDRILRAPGILDVERFPHISFRADGLEPLGGAVFLLTGELSVRDQVRPVTLEVEYLGVSEEREGRSVARFAARTEIARDEFLTWKALLGVRSWAIGRWVRLELRIAAVRGRSTSGGSSDRGLERRSDTDQGPAARMQ